MTALETIIRALIVSDGPLPLDRFMALCLGHPAHGYYTTRDPFGVKGDFTTAPEISQVFGELIGVWVAHVWESLGQPRHFALVELGPGRGTLMHDALRALSKFPACAKASQVHFVETSEVLRDAQRASVPQATWHAHVASLPALSSIIIANEFFDALPMRQFVRKSGRVFEVMVGLENEALAMMLVPSPFHIPVAGDGVFEDAAARGAVATQLGDHLAKLGGAALVIDYGHLQTALGDTLQALQNHKPCRVLDVPGEADLTSHVDFEALARAFLAGGAKIAGLATQGQFLGAMGLEDRTRVLAHHALGQERDTLIDGAQRLVHPDGMGKLFKVLCVTSPEMAQPFPFGGT